MGLKARGDNGGSTPSDDQTKKVFETFGYDSEAEKALTQDERLEQIRERGGDDAVHAAELMAYGVGVYTAMQKKPGDEDLMKEFYGVVSALAGLNKKALQTVIATALISTGELRNKLGKND